MIPGTLGEFLGAGLFERGSLSLSDDWDGNPDDRTEITAQEIDHMRALMLSEQSQGQIDHASLVRTSEEIGRAHV
jgi:hypothetical protein